MARVKALPSFLRHAFTAKEGERPSLYSGLDRRFSSRMVLFSVKTSRPSLHHIKTHNAFCVFFSSYQKQKTTMFLPNPTRNSSISYFILFYQISFSSNFFRTPNFLPYVNVSSHSNSTNLTDTAGACSFQTITDPEAGPLFGEGGLEKNHRPG